MLEINKPQTPEVRSAIERLRSRMNVGRLIMNYRVQRELSQDGLARLAGTKQSRVSEIETLDHNVTFDTLDKISMALGLAITLEPRCAPQPVLTYRNADDQRMHVYVQSSYSSESLTTMQTGPTELAMATS